jgi:TonB family protein
VLVLVALLSVAASCTRRATTGARPESAVTRAERTAPGSVTRAAGPFDRPVVLAPADAMNLDRGPYAVLGEPTAEAHGPWRVLDPMKAGAYVHVKDLPEVLHRAQPSYPHEARERGVSGSVIVQALVLADGTVGDTRPLRSVPGLDEAAMTAVSAWRFKPAMGDSGPTAVWVAVPVRFTLH